MLKVEKIKDKDMAQVKIQADPCKVTGTSGLYDCMYDCTSTAHPKFYLNPAY